MTTAGSIVLLLVRVMKVRLHAIVATIFVSRIVGVAAGISFAKIADTTQHSMGDTHGFVATVVALGTMCGTCMSSFAVTTRARKPKR
ncbi:MAG TPA: hypothetical protein VLC08_06885 [Chitinolyticbacter sp.]|nr:hypothetical protein [Chitinolyticbacter sp.]